MASLRQKQSLLVKGLQKLFEFVHSQGWEFTLGDAGSPPTRKVRVERNGRKQIEVHEDAEHMEGSLHYSRLAIDLNLFVSGRYITSSGSPVYKQIGEFWESLGPEFAWGGRFGDANHFSIEHNGKK